MAVGGLAAARDLGIAVPDDVSIVAWSGSPICRYVHPTLTALERDVIGMAATVTETLLAQVSQGAPPSVVVQPVQRLVVGGSTGLAEVLARTNSPPRGAPRKSRAPNGELRRTSAITLEVMLGPSRSHPCAPPTSPTRRSPPCGAGSPRARMRRPTRAPSASPAC